jgi:serine/threonine protein kinase
MFSPSNRLRKPSYADLEHPPRPSPPRPPQMSSQDDDREPYPVPSTNPASQYTLLDKLGTGSFGTVYKAMHNETKQIVAIKQIGACPSGPPFIL